MGIFSAILAMIRAPPLVLGLPEFLPTTLTPTPAFPPYRTEFPTAVGSRDPPENRKLFIIVSRR